MACSVDEELTDLIDPSWRGEIISTTELHAWSISQTDSALASFDADLLTYPNDNPITIYRVLYKTIDAFGNETQASGAVVIPVTDTAAPMIVYTHGTVVERYDVPGYESDELVLGMLYGADGYVAVLPDYLGMGDSPAYIPIVTLQLKQVPLLTSCAPHKVYVPI